MLMPMNNNVPFLKDLIASLPSFNILEQKRLKKVVEVTTGVALGYLGKDPKDTADVESVVQEVIEDYLNFSKSSPDWNAILKWSNNIALERAIDVVRKAGENEARKFLRNGNFDVESLVWEAIEKAEQSKDPILRRKVWVRRVVHNRALNLLRDTKDADSWDFLESEGRVPVASLDGEDGLEKLKQGEICEKAHRLAHYLLNCLLQQLAPIDANLFRFLILDRLSIVQVAERLRKEDGKSPTISALKRRWYRILGERIPKLLPEAIKNLPADLREFLSEIKPRKGFIKNLIKWIKENPESFSREQKAAEQSDSVA